MIGAQVHSNSSSLPIASPSSSISSLGTQARESASSHLHMDSVNSPASNNMETNMEFGDNFTNALNDLPLLDMEWTSTDFLSSPSFNVDSKKDINLFTPPLTTKGGGVVNNESAISESKMLLLDSILTNGESGGALQNSNTGAVSEDVSDWLDALMPSSGLTPLTENAPASVSGDPVLTPKPQDVLDLFNMDETDI